MKKLTFIIVLLFLFSSCEESGISSDSGIPTWLVGNWQMIEYQGPGDSDFKPNSGGLTIQFLPDGTFKSPGTFCTSSLALLIESNGRFDSERSILIIKDCPVQGDGLGYPVNLESDGNLVVQVQNDPLVKNKYRKL